MDRKAAGPNVELPAVRVALVHDWLTGMRGGEKCLEVLCELFPCADLFTLLHNPRSVSAAIEDRHIVTSFIQKLPGAPTGYRRYLPLFPLAAESFDLRGYDLVISTSHCVAKGVRPPTGALHLCYCFTPMRYVWDQFDAYFGPGRAGLLTRAAAHLVRRPLQSWDVRTADRVHHFIADSETVRDRIRQHYGRDSEVVFPPVDCDAFAPDPGAPDDYFLVVSAFAGYKRVDVAIEAARLAEVRLIVVGQGPDLERLRRQAHGARVEFRGWQSPADLARLYARCRALLFPGEEDFGITPLEVTASGRPVIALAAGGALETVVPGKTGILVPSASAAAWARILREFGDDSFDARTLVEHARRFDRPRFASQMRHVIAREWSRWTQKSARSHD
ncbi:MAG: glycosyltransferase [Candidatus Krumholzibacteriia bacterium]